MDEDENDARTVKSKGPIQTTLTSMQKGKKKPTPVPRRAKKAMPIPDDAMEVEHVKGKWFG
jgi:hypothetical protein